MPVWQHQESLQCLHARQKRVSCVTRTRTRLSKASFGGSTWEIRNRLEARFHKQHVEWAREGFCRDVQERLLVVTYVVDG